MIGDIFAAIIYIFFFLAMLTMAWAALSAAPWVPSRSKDIKRILKLAGNVNNKKIYDMGCGDAKIICALAKEGAEAVGFEVSLFQYFQSLSRIFFLKLKNENLKVKVKYKNFWSEDLADADVVYVFLMQRIYPKLKVKLQKELKEGVRVIVYAWPIEGLNLLEKDTAPGQLPIYLYEI